MQLKENVGRERSPKMVKLQEKYLKEPILKKCKKCGADLRYKEHGIFDLSPFLYKCKKCGAEYPKYTKKEWEKLAMRKKRDKDVSS